jgi:hypothetical protein
MMMMMMHPVETYQELRIWLANRSPAGEGFVTYLADCSRVLKTVFVWRRLYLCGADCICVLLETVFCDRDCVFVAQTALFVLDARNREGKVSVQPLNHKLLGVENAGELIPSILGHRKDWLIFAQIQSVKYVTIC